MIGITLSSDQIRAAPAEVRRWIEHEVTVSLGLQAGRTDDQARIEHLAICSLEELGSVLSLIQGVFPAVNVFFELGREGASFGQGRVEAYRLIDILHHVRLQSVGQVVSCLDLINEALRRVRGAADATFYGLDNNGHCFIAVQTQQNILRLWRDVIGGKQIAAAESTEARSQAMPDDPHPAFGGEDDRPTANQPSG